MIPGRGRTREAPNSLAPETASAFPAPDDSPTPQSKIASPPYARARLSAAGVRRRAVAPFLDLLRTDTTRRNVSTMIDCHVVGRWR